MSSQETFMRYFYIICLVLSSFFIYNLSSADNIGRKYAFFVPGNAYQKNTDVNNLNTMRTRYKKPTTSNKTDTASLSKTKKTKTKTAEKLTHPVTKKPLKEMATIQQTPQIKAKEAATIAKQENTVKEEAPVITTTTSAPVADTSLPTQLSSTETDTPIEEQLLSQEDLDKIKEKAAQYNIEEDDFIIAPFFSAEAEQKEEKTINTMLSEIPYPNSDDPKFKQAFGKYGIALRTLYRQKTMPNDYEQDKILAKATSIKRFKVEAPN